MEWRGLGPPWQLWPLQPLTGPSRPRFYWQRLKSEDAPKIHVALSISLFLLNLVFFINMGVGRRASEAACRAHGAVFHYFLLCTFTWMGLEAFHLYLLIIRVFNTYFGHYFLKLSLVGWGRRPGRGREGTAWQRAAPSLRRLSALEGWQKEGALEGDTPREPRQCHPSSPRAQACLP